MGWAQNLGVLGKEKLQLRDYNSEQLSIHSSKERKKEYIKNNNWHNSRNGFWDDLDLILGRRLQKCWGKQEGCMWPVLL